MSPGASSKPWFLDQNSGRLKSYPTRRCPWPGTNIWTPEGTHEGMIVQSRGWIIDTAGSPIIFGGNHGKSKVLNSHSPRFQEDGIQNPNQVNGGICQVVAPHFRQGWPRQLKLELASSWDKGYASGLVIWLWRLAAMMVRLESTSIHQFFQDIRKTLKISEAVGCSRCSQDTSHLAA